MHEPVCMYHLGGGGWQVYTVSISVHILTFEVSGGMGFTPYINSPLGVVEGEGLLHLLLHLCLSPH